MSAHTPGPWKLETVPTSIGSCHKIGPFPGAGVRPEVHACVYADGIRIGIDDTLPIAKQLLDNARLMAASPEMLDALKDAWAELSCSQRRSSYVLDKVSKAIAKATGSEK